MANYTAGPVWVLDTAGLITDKPIKILGGRLVPASAGQYATLKYFLAGGNSDETHSTGTAQTTTVATNTVTSTGNFTAAKVTAGDGLVIDYTETGNNKGTYYVVSRDSDNQVTLGAVAAASMTDETSKKYSWKVYKVRTAVNLVTSGTEVTSEYMDELPVLPNLVLTAITGGTLYLYVA